MEAPNLTYVALLIFAWVVPLTHCLSPACNLGMYGQPIASECHELWAFVTKYQIPYPRYFLEEQIRALDENGSWPGLDHALGRASNVQLPKYYSLSEAFVLASLCFERFVSC